jgi:hypothetical protein
METRLSRRVLAASIIAASCEHKVAGVLARSSPATPSPETATLPDTPAGRQLQWVINVLNGVEPVPSVEAIREHFADLFLEQVSADQMVGFFLETGPQFAPILVLAIAGVPTPLLLDVVVETVGNSNAKFVVSISVEQQFPNKINGLLFQPYDLSPSATPSLTTWPDISLALSAAGPILGLHVEELTAKGEAANIEEINPRETLAIGSIFKLYVLSALATKIEQGDLSWDQLLTVTPELKSLPSGVTQTEPDGTQLTVEELSRRMISISDNTAADILIDAVSREACEQALVTLGNSVPELNVPFLTTREMFILKHGGDSDILQRYATGDTAGRQEILAEIATSPLPDLATAKQSDKPVEIERVEWFATAPNISEAIAWLWAKGAERELDPLREILTLNSGVLYDESVWTSVAFKGGSEVGVLAFGWLLERNDGRTFTVTGGVNNPEKALSEETIIAAASSAFPLLAEIA